MCEDVVITTITAVVSTHVGLLGEAPVNKSSVYSQLNVQCAILSVYLAALAQQVTTNALCS